METHEEKLAQRTKEQHQKQAQIYAFLQDNSGDESTELSHEEIVEVSEKLHLFVALMASELVIKKELQDRREDLFQCIENRYGEDSRIARMLKEAIPNKRLNQIVEKWRDKLGEDDSYIEVCHEVWDKCLRAESWYGSLDRYGDKDVLFYKLYLREWFSMHDEGNPYSIQEFIENHLKNEKIQKYYQELAEKEPESFIERIMDRAEENNYLHQDREVAVEIMELAYRHYNLDLEGLLHAEPFDFAHDVIQIFTHYHADRQAFDNHFLPRYALPKK